MYTSPERELEMSRIAAAQVAFDTAYPILAAATQLSTRAAIERNMIAPELTLNEAEVAALRSFLGAARRP